MTHALVLIAVLLAGPPDPALTVPCRIVRVIDGDTVEVEVRQVYRVRLLDCWAPERKEKGGPESTEHLSRLIDAGGRDAVLSVPWRERAAERWSLGRVLGRVWIAGQEKSLSEQQVMSGHALPTKETP